MIKVKEFFGLGRHASIRDYQEFIESNQQIEIISVNVIGSDIILLTYKD